MIGWLSILMSFVKMNSYEEANGIAKISTLNF